MKKLNEVFSRKILNFKQFALPKFVLSFFLTVAFLIACQDFSDSYAQQDIVRIHFIDVGYGDSIFIEFPDARNMLIDAGEKYYTPQLMNYLSSLDASAIDIAVITHPHQNHFEGYFNILESYSVKHLYINGDENAEEGYGELLALFRQKSIPIQILKRGDKIGNLPDSVQIEVLHPEQLSGNANGNSLVLWLKHKDISVLFMADIGPKEQKELLRFHKDIKKAELIQIPHHGGPISDDFTHAFKNKIFIISTGTNQWGWPKAHELQKLEGTIYRTDTHKSIVIESDGFSVLVQTPTFGKE